MKLVLEKGARDEKGLMVFSPSIRQFFFFFFFFGSSGALALLPCRLCAQTEFAIFGFVCFFRLFCFVLFWLLYVAAPAATYLRNNRREFAYIRSNNRRDLLLLNFVFLHTREIFRILGLAERERKGPS
jgi:hypothetical protein